MAKHCHDCKCSLSFYNYCPFENLKLFIQVFQALHYDRTLASKRVRIFWVVFGFVERSQTLGEISNADIVLLLFGKYFHRYGLKLIVIMSIY